MTTVGGLRSRLIFDSVYHTIKDGLKYLGWFDGGRRHAPIFFVAEPQETETEIPLNTVALSDENINSKPIELGSELAEHTRWFYVDMFAEDDAVGKHLIGDIKDILEGRMPSIGRSGPVVDIYDYRMATPQQVATCYVQNVQVDRAHGWNKPWLRHWYSVQFQLVDTYSSEND